MTPEETKERLHQYLGLKLELNNRLRRLAHLQQLDQTAPAGRSRSEEYALQIAPIVQRNRREMEAISQGIQTLKSPSEREVLRLRYLEPSKDPQTGKQSVRHTPWHEIAYTLLGKSTPAACKEVLRIQDRAIKNLTEYLTASEQ